MFEQANYNAHTLLESHSTYVYVSMYVYYIIYGAPQYMSFIC